MINQHKNINPATIKAVNNIHRQSIMHFHPFTINRGRREKFIPESEILKSSLIPKDLYLWNRFPSLEVSSGCDGGERRQEEVYAAVSKEKTLNHYLSLFFSLSRCESRESLLDSSFSSCISLHPLLARERGQTSFLLDPPETSSRLDLGFLDMGFAERGSGELELLKSLLNFEFNPLIKIP